MTSFSYISVDVKHPVKEGATLNRPKPFMITDFDVKRGINSGGIDEAKGEPNERVNHPFF